MKNQTAIITGITGQDGAYLAKDLIKKGYRVIGVSRGITEPSFLNLKRLDINNSIEIIRIDLSKKDSLENLISYTKPDKLFNLAAQSFIPTSFDFPSSTVDINSIAGRSKTIRKRDPLIKVARALNIYIGEI